jgi:putative membrane protein
MHTGRSYRLFEFLDRTRRDIYVLIVLGVVPAVAYQTGNMKWLGIPWTVVALLTLTLPRSQGSSSIVTSPG